MVDGKGNNSIRNTYSCSNIRFRVLPKGTAYQTDTGMCGDYDSVIGGDKKIAG